MGNMSSQRADFAEQVAIVTGAATGIGQEIAALFLRRGAAGVVIADINGPMAERTAAELQAIGPCVAIPTDVSDEASVAAMVTGCREAFGRVDSLVTSAGVHLHKLVVDTSLDEWNRQLSVQLSGPFLCAREVARDMLAHGTRGSIVNIVSAAARMGRVKGAAHCASKAGLTLLTQVLAMELGPHGIRANAVGPGLIDTESQRDETVMSTAYKTAYMKEIPLGTLGEPIDIAEAVLFLCSDAARWLTGQTLYVDGGFLAGNLSLQGLADLFDETPMSHRAQ
jgi:NAD(P)-dependent dehydrogenase (short-subunit alcohol dehydrogenase family)